MRRKQAVTAKDIANACGISQATVSYVINNKAGKRVSEKTRQLVLETAKRLNYIPNSTARSMRTNRAMSIGIVSGRNNISIGFNHVLRGIKQYLDETGYTITLLNADDFDPEALEYIRYYQSGRIDAILFLFYDIPDATLELLSERQIPYITVNENGVWGDGMERKKAFDQVITECADFCRKRDYRRIRFFSLQYGERLYSNKFNLFSGALVECFPEAELKRVVIQSRDLTNEELILRLDDCIRGEEFDLAVTANQRLGWLMQGSILKNHFVLPQSIKHICLASSHIFNLVYPTITSIDIPLTEMGRFAAEQIVRILGGEAPEEREFSCTLREGMSTE